MTTTQTNTHPARIAQPGSVQNQLDAAKASRFSKVSLLPETAYNPSATWRIPSGVTLDYNGAFVELTRSIDIHEIAPGGKVTEPMIDLQSVNGGFSNSVFVFDSRRYGFYGKNRSWHVQGGLTHGQPGDGTLYEFRQGNENAIYFVHCDHTVWGIGTVVDMHRGDAFGINGNRFYGTWRGFQRGIHMHNRSKPARSIDNISGNHFDVIAQPTDSDILWDMEVGHFNVLKGRLWDFDNYDDVMWRIHGNNAEKRYGNILEWFPVGGNQQKLFDEVGPSVFEDQLGDPRNRVIIPWLLGQPVVEFTSMR